MSEEPPKDKYPGVDLLRESFRIFDINGDDKLSAKELGEILRSMGQTPTADDLEEMIREYDTNGNGLIDFDEFLKLMYDNEFAIKNVDELKEAFRMFDINNNGVITVNELREIMNNLGENLSEEELEAMIRVADFDGDGQVSFADFIKIMQG